MSFDENIKKLIMKIWRNDHFENVKKDEKKE